MTDFSRRAFIGSTIAGSLAAQEVSRSMQTESIPMRPLGKTGVQVSALGLGGYHLGSAKDLDEAKRIVDEAIDNGVNFFDNCWDYHGGKSEEWMGDALHGKRDKVVLMTKVCTPAAIGGSRCGCLRSRFADCRRIIWMFGRFMK
jgi:uncharacterized protein